MTLAFPVSDVGMSRVRKATVRDLRYRFPEVERLLEKGEKIEITKRGRVIARLLPVGSRAPRRRPDFLARLRAIYGAKTLKLSGAELMARERARY
jgi:antitoxin (DNA-binding transcriptional repressor) of toxin-antitoxin stability system